MPPILKPIALHTIVGNAPHIDSVAATAAPGSFRQFVGTGAPSSSTLGTGNNKYNGLSSGWLINASLYATGTGYVVGDVLTVSGGTGTAAQITIDMVASAGAIVDFHISTAGNYSVYPAAIEGVTGGTGSSAQFLINVPPPDYYLDITTPTAPVLYVCQSSGSSSSSVWSQVSSGNATGACQQFKIVSDGGDYWICNTWDGTTLGTINQNIIKPYKLRAGTNAIGAETIRTVTYTYTYTAVTVGGVTGYYTRGVSGSDGSSETDYMTPDPIAGDIIYAMPSNIGTGFPVTIASVAVATGGHGYVANVIVTLAGGTVAPGGAAATIKILTVNGSGGVLTCQLQTSGNYTTPPPLTGATDTSSNATYNLTLAPQLLDINADGRAWSK